MGGEQPRASIADRVAALTGDQRRALAALLAGQTRGEAEAGTPESVDDRGRPDRLVACVTTDGPPPSAEALDGFLGERLPDYMIPSRYVRLDGFARNAAGKLDRARVDPAAGTELPRSVAGTVGPRNETEARLLEIWKEVLGLDQISVLDNFFEIGGDSLLSIRAISRAGRAGISIEPESFFRDATIAGIAAAAGSGAPAAEQGPVVGDAPLTPIQEWFFDRITSGRDHWNQAVLLRVPATVGHGEVEGAVRALADHHDALRLRFERTADGWRQVFDPPGDVTVRVVELSGDVGDHARVMEAEADAEHRSLDLEEGHLFRGVLFDGGPDFRRLLLLSHHLLVDAVSWGILLDDLSTLLAQAAAASPFRLPPKTASARAWALELATLAASPMLDGEEKQWDRTPPESWIRVPRDLNAREDANTMGDAATHILALDETATSAGMNAARGRSDAGPRELLLAALLLAWSRWSGQEGLQLDLEGHGRGVLGDRWNVSRTVGWFTTVFPLVLALPEPDAGSALDAARSALDHLSLGGAAHGLLRYRHPDPAVRDRLAAAIPSEVLLNYIGSVDSMIPPDSGFEVASEPVGRQRSAEAPRAYVIEINAQVERRRLSVKIEYSQRLHHADSIARLAAELEGALGAVSASGDEGESGFELAGLDAAGLDRVADLLAEVDDD